MIGQSGSGMEPVTFSRTMKIVAAVFGVLMIGLLVLNNLQIGGQLAVVKQQRDFQAQADPLVRDGRILAEDARDRLPEATRAARDAAALVRATRPLVGDLDRVDVDDVLVAVGSLAEGLNTRNRLVRLVDRSDRLVSEIDRSGVIDSTARATRRAPDFMDEVLRIQRETRDLQRQSLAVQRETLAIQKEALVHIRSIDSKTGGPAPGAVPAR
jgi:hypothetical protein